MNTEPKPAERTDSVMEGRGQMAQAALTVFMGIGLFLAWRFAAKTHTLLAAGLEAVLLWSFTVGLVHSIYRKRDAAVGDSWLSFPYTGQWLAIGSAVVLLVNLCDGGIRYPLPLEHASLDSLHFAAPAWLVYAIVLSFVVQYASLVRGGTSGHAVIQLARLASFATGLAAILIFLFLSMGWDFTAMLGGAPAVITLVLMLESAARLCSRFFLPPSLRQTPAPIGGSVLLDLLGGSARGWRALVADLESLLGTKLSELWVLRFLRDATLPALLALVLLAWLSTCLTAVPLGSRGVLETLGRFSPQSLVPGLHVTLPWPIQQIAIVPTESVQEVSLGFEQDLSGPLFWTERHYTNEHNLLIDGGESLLVIDVPVQFRIANPVAYLQASSDPVSALRSMAERELIRLTQGHAGFDIMTQGRTAIADGLRAALQDDVDRTGLGLQIVFVGLKDVHPPVEVAPAYENVVSAEETEAATIDLAKGYSASQLPDAQARAQRLVTEADANATQRVDLATGEAGSFTALVQARAESPALFGLRLRYDALIDALPGPTKFIVGMSGQAKMASYLNLRALGSFAPGVAVPQQSVPLSPPARSMPAEVPEH